MSINQPSCELFKQKSKHTICVMVSLEKVNTKASRTKKKKK